MPKKNPWLHHKKPPCFVARLRVYNFLVLAFLYLFLHIFLKDIRCDFHYEAKDSHMYCSPFQDVRTVRMSSKMRHSAKQSATDAGEPDILGGLGELNISSAPSAPRTQAQGYESGLFDDPFGAASPPQPPPPSHILRLVLPADKGKGLAVQAGLTRERNSPGTQFWTHHGLPCQSQHFWPPVCLSHFSWEVHHCACPSLAKFHGKSVALQQWCYMPSIWLGRRLCNCSCCRQLYYEK